MIGTIVVDGVERKLGCLPRRVPVGSVFPVFDSPRTPIIPRKEWRPVDWSHFVDQVLDQDGTAACNAFASVQCMHVLRRMNGLPFVLLSAGNLYGRINNGRDEGSYLSDSLLELQTNGVCRASIVPMLEWRQHRWPPEWKADAIKFRAVEVYDCPSFDHLVSAILQGFVVNLGIMVGNNFTVQPDGWLRDYTGGYGGHAMCGVGVDFHPTRHVWGIKVVNSWGDNWGREGFAIVPESYFKSNWFQDGWAIRVVVDPEGSE